MGHVREDVCGLVGWLVGSLRLVLDHGAVCHLSLCVEIS